MAPKQVSIKSAQAHKLNEATEELISSIQHKDKRLRMWAIISWTVLLSVGVGGIYRQNQIAQQNKSHIDCIVKLLATPLPKGQVHKVISDASNTCNINFTQ